MNNDAAINAWMKARPGGREITNADLIELLQLLPPGEVPLLLDPDGIYEGARLTRAMLAVGEKSFRLYIDGYTPPSNGREIED